MNKIEIKKILGNYEKSFSGTNRIKNNFNIKVTIPK